MLFCFVLLTSWYGSDAAVVFFFGEGVCGSGTDAVWIRVAKGKVLMPNWRNMEPKRCQKRSTWTRNGAKRVPKWDKGPPKTSLAQQGRKSEENDGPGLQVWEYFLDKNRQKHHPPLKKMIASKHENVCHKGANMEPNSMRIFIKNPSKTLSRTKMRRIMEKHVFLMCKIMQIYHTVIKKQGFARWVRERKNHQKNIKHEIKIHAEIDDKSVRISCLEKWYKKNRKSLKNYPKRDAKTIRNLCKNSAQNLMRKWSPSKGQPSVLSLPPPPCSDHVSRNGGQVGGLPAKLSQPVNPGGVGGFYQYYHYLINIIIIL